MSPQAEQEVAVDGRRERTESTRRKILKAARELILAGDFDPTASAISTHAGLTRRTLFRHFPDMGTLHSEIIVDAQDYTQTVMDEPFPASTTDWREQLAVVIGRRVRIYEYLRPLYISTVYQSYRAAVASEPRSRNSRRRRRRLKTILPQDILSNTLLIESLDAILSIEYWISLRDDQQLSVAKAERVLRYTIEQMTRSSP